MKIYTSYYKRWKDLQAAGLLLVGISRYPCRFCPAHVIAEYKWELAPLPATLKLPQEEYVPKFLDELHGKQPGQILAQLNRLSDRNEGRHIALLCFEAPDEFCHRRLVAHWLEAYTGEPVPEWNGQGTQYALFPERKNSQLSIF